MCVLHGFVSFVFVLVADVLFGRVGTGGVESDEREIQERASEITGSLFGSDGRKSHDTAVIRSQPELTFPGSWRLATSPLGLKRWGSLVHLNIKLAFPH